VSAELAGAEAQHAHHDRELVFLNPGAASYHDSAPELLEHDAVDLLEHHACNNFDHVG
jgi:hypothetical protein